MKNTTMKPLRTLLLSLLTVAALVGCNNPKKLAKVVANVELKNEPEVIEVRGDSISFNLRGKFPPKTFAKNAVIKFQPILKYGNNEERPLKPIYLRGEKVKLDAQMISYKNGGTFSYKDKMPYTPEMKNTVMSLDYTVKFASSYDELQQCVSDTRDSVVRGSVITALTVQPTDDIYFYTNDEPVGGFRKIIFYYAIDEGFLRDSVMKGPTLAQMRRLARDTNFKFNLITLNSYASPDGEFTRNKTLVRERAESAYKLVKSELKRLGVTRVADSSLIRRPDINYEDWDGLKLMVSNSNLDGKDEVLGIINSSLTLPEKEDALRKLPIWNTLKTSYLPRLRRTEVVFSGSFPNRSYADALNMANQNMDLLTPKELLLVANNTQDAAMKTSIYKYYMEKYGNDWAGKNNYAIMLLENGKAEIIKDPFSTPESVVTAEKYLEELNAQFPNNDTIINNLGVAKRYLRKYGEAKALYNEAKRNGLDMDYNLGVLYIKYGDYDQATNSFASVKKCDYNVALGYMLKGDYEVALQKIECIENKKSEDFYLRAVVAARKGDKDLMNTSLTRAVSMNPALHDVAKEDLEFRKYVNSAEFRNAIKVQ
ncbi:MAG: hypothetical protein SGJ04_00935 [Bacteroidota bacterium]|nr:hypothetical protein [Bacteroidota bacterium]